MLSNAGGRVILLFKKKLVLIYYFYYSFQLWYCIWIVDTNEGYTEYRILLSEVCLKIYF